LRSRDPHSPPRQGPAPVADKPRTLTPAQAHAQLEAILVAVMQAADPPAELQRRSADPTLPATLRRALTAADPDGVRLAALLVCKLRFERLLRASPEAERLFTADPAAFAQTFRRYHESTPLHDFFPQREAQRFQAFLAKTSDEPPT
jgi:hypothetical protein